tara:strand:- start:158 stop:931 length:774 start_codon:yes stop_codon:yes gene_type:complete
LSDEFFSHSSKGEQLTGRKREADEGWALTRADVLFLIDCTKTMEGSVNYIQGVRDSIEEIVNTFHKEKCRVRLALIEFRDRVHQDNEDALRIHSFENGSFTDSIDEFSNALEQLEPIGGGPEDESVFDALLNGARELDWDPNGEHIMVLFSDAAPRRRDLEAKSPEDVIAELEKAEIDQIHLLTKEEHRSRYEPLLYAQKASGEDITGAIYELGHSEAMDEFRKKLLQITKSSIGKMVANKVRKGTGSSSNLIRQRK